jgi:Tfp pilus assembly protein PilO
MIKNFKWAMLKEPRYALRAAVGTLLVLNLAAAVFAFKPFGGSAADLRKQKSDLLDQLAAHQAQLAISKRLVNKEQAASHDGDEFLRKYVSDRRVVSSALFQELTRMATESGVQVGQISNTFQDIEGSDTMQMLSVSVGIFGTYPSLTKFVNLVDKSPRFLIIESMQTSAPQHSGQPLAVQFKLDTFVQSSESSAL